MKALKAFVKKETVLSVALLLAVLSALIVPPDREYISYIDFRTLAILFSLMAVMAGFRRQHVFDDLGRFLLTRAHGMLQIALVLVLLCFFSSMLITNDVALITFVPFTFVVLNMLGAETRRRWILPVVGMQTIAANLGSMLTPIGNPQNLYLYGKAGIGMGQFVKLMLPYALAALVLLIIWAFVLSRTASSGSGKLTINWTEENAPHDTKKLILHGVLFVICLLTVVRVLPYQAMFAIVLAAVLIADREVLGQVDYSLLLTFVGFFIFVNNLGRVEWFSTRICSLMEGREMITAVIISQVISNVPAALMLSGFTSQFEALIVGTNLGGLGTLIASMASLISYRQIAREEPARKGEYFLLFTVSNVVFLVVLLILSVIL